eukprot:TRINITY_DN80909_c0_g1_i1.p1 TRINITY_DN80909_c0_g1~~TRINITY_DN80909_c0_g1_i1.p1  ORF type:complete len:509 (-),score=121.74 TRINITY_DN80909_c0_g1_i1:65-1591(-)
MGFGQFAASTQFYLYGKKHFTSSGWERHKAKYEQPDLLESGLDLTGKTFMVTGANSGIGKEIASFLAVKGASVYMVCRSQQRAEAARDEILAAAGESAREKVHILLADCGLEADVRRCWDEFCSQSLQHTQDSETVRLDGLVCNAGALSNTKQLTKDGVELTFASHLLFGTYLLGSLAMPCLEATPGSRLVVVSSGGMYNFAFPEWEKATATGDAAYDGQYAYAYAKRGQVLLCEQWAAAHPKVPVVSCHPGWTITPGVEEAYGSSKSWLEPLRTPWQGAEGIAWLCVVDAQKLESGAFYLDRTPQVKHIAGPFFTEGSVTKNTPGEVSDMMRLLEDWANGRRDSQVKLTSAPLTALNRPIDLAKFMGKWYVVANIPTFFDRGTTNNVENYTLDEAGKTVEVDFTFCKSASSKQSLLKQRADVVNENCTEWRISPKVGVYLPLRLAYLIVDCADDYSTAIVGVPDRSYIWIMARTPQVEAATLESLKATAKRLGYDVTQIVNVPQQWD